MAGHLLVLEDLARILTLTGRTVRTVRDGHAVGGAQTGEVPALHGAGKALTLGTTLDIDQLPGDIMIGRDFHADVEEVVLGHAEFGDDRLGLDFGLAEVTTLGLREILRLGAARAKLDGRIAVTIRLTTGDHLDALQLQHGDRHMAPILLKQPGHPHLLCDHASTHDQLLKQRLARSLRQACQRKRPASPQTSSPTS